MEGWVVAGAVILFVVGKFLYSSWAHPASVLVRQGISMNWVVSGGIAEADGSRSTRLVREELEAKVTYRPATVRLLVPPLDQSFSDFVEVESWLGKASAVLAIKKAGGLPAELAPKNTKVTSPALLAFEKEITTWPRDKAELALRVLCAVFDGDKETYQRLHGDLTVGQIMRVTEVLKQVEQEAHEADLRRRFGPDTKFSR